MRWRDELVAFRATRIIGKNQNRTQLRFFCARKSPPALRVAKKQIKKSPHEAGKITGFYRGFLHRDITQHLDGSKVSNALYGFVIAR